MHDEDSIDITECLADPNARSPLEVLEVNNRNRELAALIDRLPEKERLVLSLYYWEELTMKEIGKVMSLSEGRVCQLHSQALIKMKAKLNGCLSSREV
jgi:RNA polymerase sigma factor for flagellar operon FliA